VHTNLCAPTRVFLGGDGGMWRVREAVQTMPIILLASRSEAVQRLRFFEIFVVGIVERSYVRTTLQYRLRCERLDVSSS
jgi:hypothetical protein